MTDTTWITHRLPTEADGDGDGEVIARFGPNDDNAWAYFDWSLVRHGMSWRRTDRWRPPVQRRIDFKVGQRWVSRSGQLALITGIDNHPEFPVNSDLYGLHAHGLDGRSCLSGKGREHQDDLVELLESVSPEPIIAQTKRELICTFEHGGRIYQAVAWPAEPTLREQALRLVADLGMPNYQFTAVQVATIRAALEDQP